MSDKKLRRAVQRANPERYRYLIELEATADRDLAEGRADVVSFVWTDAYGHTVEWGRAGGWADAKAECLRRSMQDNGWIAGEHRFTDRTFIVVPGPYLPDIIAAIVPWVRENWGPEIKG